MELCTGNGRVAKKDISLALPYVADGSPIPNTVDAAQCAATAEVANQVSQVPLSEQNEPLTRRNANTLALWSVVKTEKPGSTTFAYDAAQGEFVEAPGSNGMPSKVGTPTPGTLTSEAIALVPGSKGACIDPLPDIALGASIKTAEQYRNDLSHFAPSTSETSSLLIDGSTVELVKSCAGWNF